MNVTFPKFTFDGNSYLGAYHNSHILRWWWYTPWDSKYIYKNQYTYSSFCQMFCWC